MKNVTPDTIEDYLLENLSPEDRKAFEAQMEADADLADTVARTRLEHRAMELMLQDDLRHQMAAWKQERAAQSDETGAQSAPREAKRILFSARFARLAAAASLLLVIAFAARWIWGGPALSGEALAEQYYQAPPAGMHRGENEIQNATFEQAMSLMSENQYEAALPLLSEISDPELLTPALFQQLHAYYSLGQYTQAATIATQILSTTEDALLQQRAEWALLLANLAEGKQDQAFYSLLDKIIQDSNHAFSGKAAELKKKL